MPATTTLSVSPSLNWAVPVIRGCGGGEPLSIESIVGGIVGVVERTRTVAIDGGVNRGSTSVPHRSVTVPAKGLRSSIPSRSMSSEPGTEPTV